MVVYVCGSFIRLCDYPKGFWYDIYACMDAGDEILLGDSDLAHRVYGRCRSKQYEKVSEKNNCVEMLKKCNRMIAIWDGKSREPLESIMLLLMIRKPCRLYYLPDNECLELTSVGDIPPMQPGEGWTAELMRRILEECGFYEDMINHTLANGIPTEHLMTEIICKAPVSITRKRKMLEQLTEASNATCEAFYAGLDMVRAGRDLESTAKLFFALFGRRCDELCDALGKLSLAEMYRNHCTYYLFDEWYDTDVLIERSEPCGLFGTLKQAIDYIRKEMELEQEDMEEGDEPCPSWYRIEAWNLDEWDRYEHAYNYYIYNGKICWFERMEMRGVTSGSWYYTAFDKKFIGGLSDLNIPTPFKAGDIVEVDCRPFGPPFHALIVEGRNQNDDSSPTILFKVPYTDKWKMTGLKYKMFYKDADGGTYVPRLSPLYRLRSVGKDEFNEADELLVKVAEWIAGDEERGAAFWDSWHECPDDERTDEDALGVLEKVSGAV